MKMLRTYFFKILSVCVLTATFGSPALHANDQANTNRGNFEVGGGFSATHRSVTNSNVDSKTEITLRAPVQFFILNGLSLGGEFAFTHYNSNENYYFGPAATFYFANTGRLTGYVGASVLFSIMDDGLTDDAKTYNGRLGMKYFIVPAVAIGPEVGFSHLDISNTNRDVQNAYVSAVFSIHI